MSRRTYLLPAALLLALAGCSLQPAAPLPSGHTGTAQTHPRYAPPPGGKAAWDPQLGVYVIQGRNPLYYRERVYYRWDHGWSWASNPQGAWQPIDSSGVPAALGRHFAN